MATPYKIVPMELTMGSRYNVALCTFRSPLKQGRGVISGQKQVTVHLVRDDPTHLKIPKGFFEFVLVGRGWVAF